MRKEDRENRNVTGWGSVMQQLSRGGMITYTFMVTVLTATKTNKKESEK